MSRIPIKFLIGPILIIGIVIELQKQMHILYLEQDTRKFKSIYSKKVDETTGIIGSNCYTKRIYNSKDYQEKIINIKLFDNENQKKVVFLTNNFELNDQEIALPYKQRWQIKLFFKWIKQHLKLRPFREQQKMPFLFK